MNALDSRIIHHFKALLLSRIRVNHMFLFGSRARGDADPQSDLDVLVVVDGRVDDGVRDSISECTWGAGFEYGIVVVPVVFTLHEWESAPERSSLLSQAVEKEGIPV